MTPKERERRKAIRKKLKAKRARALMREYARNKIAPFKAKAIASEGRAMRAEVEKERIQKHFNDLAEMILCYNPDFPVPGREPRLAPRYLKESGFIDRPGPIRRPFLAISSRADYTKISCERIREWFSLIRGDIEESPLMDAKVFRMDIIDRENAKHSATQYAISNTAMRSAVAVEYLLENTFRKMSSSLIDHVRTSRA